MRSTIRLATRSVERLAMHHLEKRGTCAFKAKFSEITENYFQFHFATKSIMYVLCAYARMHAYTHNDADFIADRQRYVQEKSLVGITNDNPLVEADLMTDLDFCRADGSIPMALNDSKESVLELCLLSSAASLFAAARSSL